MKILYISGADLSGTSGPSVNERCFVPALHRVLGDDCRFLIPHPKGSLSNDIPLNSVTFYRQGNINSPHKWFLQQIDLVKKANILLENNKFDMVLLRAGLFTFSHNYLLTKHKIPYALKTAGSGEFQVFERKNFLIKSLKGLNEKLYRKLVNNAFFVDVVSPMQRDSLRNITGENEKIQWIDNGVDLNKFKPVDRREARKNRGLDRFSHIIGYAGNFPWERGGMQIVRSLPKLKRDFPDVGALVVGGGDKMDLLFDEAKKLGVYDSCVFTGNVSFDDVPELINCMDIGISQRYKETQGASELKVRQYLACGKPVIVTPGGANDFVMENGLGYITDPNNQNEFVGAVKNILSLELCNYIELSVKAASFAADNLSYESKIKERLFYYEKSLGK